MIGSATPSIPIDTPQDEYCAWLELRNVMDGVTATTDLACVSHGEHPRPGETRPSEAGYELGQRTPGGA